MSEETSVRPFVDWHSHIWLPEHLGPEWGRELDSHYTHVPSEHGTPGEHRAAMDRAGVSHAVVLALTSRHLSVDVPNEFVAEYVATDPGRLVGFASVDPNDPDAPARLRYAVGDLGLRGVKLAPPYQDFHPHSDEAWAVYRAADALGAVVMFHQGAVSHRRGVLDHAQPLLLDRVAREFPELRIVIAHMGQPWPHEVVPLLRKHPNVYADLSARCTRPWQLKGILLAALDYGVQHKLLFGSDFPTFDPGEHARALLSVNDGDPGGRPVPADVLDAIVHSRPLSLLGLDT
jgi:predicted TIM-barrel fold metal-dependent hydrolase